MFSPFSHFPPIEQCKQGLTHKKNKKKKIPVAQPENALLLVSLVPHPSRVKPLTSSRKPYLRRAVVENARE